MRIDQLLHLLDTTDFHDFPSFNHNTVSNLDAARLEFSRLAQAPELRSALEPILTSSIFGTDRDEFITAKADELQSAVYRLQLLILGLREVLRQHAAPPSAESIVIKLPDPNDLADALHSTEQFRIAIEQIVTNDAIRGHIKLVGWETGSFWLYLALGTPAAVALIGSVAWSAAVIRKKILEGSILKKQVEAMEIKNDALTAVAEGVEREVQMLVESEANAIFNMYFTGDDPELIQRLQFSIKSFSELLAKGAEVHPSLQAPEHVSNLFPDPKKLDSITSKIAQLADKASGGA